MTGPELKAWRKARGLSQAALARLLDWTRDVLYNREAGRVAMPDDIETKLAAIVVPAAAPKSSTSVPIPHGSECLNMGFKPLGYYVPLRDKMTLPLNYLFWRYTGGTVFNLYQINGRTGRPNCTFIQLNMATWQAHHVTGHAEPFVDKINQWLDENNAYLESLPMAPMRPQSKDPT